MAHLRVMSRAPIVRAAVAADAIALQSLYRQLVDDEKVNVAESQIQAIEDGGHGRLFVCENDGHVVATALVSLCADVMYGSQPFAVIDNIVVSRRCRGQGIGRLLLREVEQFCLLRDCSKVMLLSSALRVDAHRFFEHAGFRSDVKRGFVKYRRQFDPRAERSEIWR